MYVLLFEIWEYLLSMLCAFLGGIALGLWYPRRVVKEEVDDDE